MAPIASRPWQTAAGTGHWGGIAVVEAVARAAAASITASWQDATTGGRRNYTCRSVSGVLGVPGSDACLRRTCWLAVVAARAIRPPGAGVLGLFVERLGG